MNHPVEKIFALDQILAVLERRLDYEAFDYDTAVPALGSAITHFEQLLTVEDRQRLDSTRSQHSFYKSKSKPKPQSTKLCPSCEEVMESFGGTRTGVFCPKCHYMKSEPTEAEKNAALKARKAIAEWMRSGGAAMLAEAIEAGVS